MKLTLAAVALAMAFPMGAVAQSPIASIAKTWTFDHAINGVSGFTAEVAAFDQLTNSIWIAGVKGVDVLDVNTGTFLQHIDTSVYGSINSISIHNGLAAFAIEANERSTPGVVKLFDTSTRALASGVNSITVGALPDMVTFTPNGSRLLVANEGTPDVYGARIGSTVPRVYGAAPNDPVGSVSIIDMSTRSVIATAGFDGVPLEGSFIRTNTGMNFEPENIAVNAQGTQAFVTLQEANAIGVLDLNTNSFAKVVGLGVKDFSLPGNSIDPLNNGVIEFVSPNVKGLYMPDGIASYQAAGTTYWVMANEGDFREDDGDRSTGRSLGETGLLENLRVSNTDSSPDNLFITGARSFSIRDGEGNIVYDSGDILDKKAAELGIYDDGRSRDKGVEPEGISILEVGGRSIAAVGLERTLTSAVALFDITDPNNVSFLEMIVSEGDRAPEGLMGFQVNNLVYLAVPNESSNTTSLFLISPVPEPNAFALMLLGMPLITFIAKRKKAIA